MKLLFYAVLFSLCCCGEKIKHVDSSQSRWEYPIAIQNPMDAKKYVWENKTEAERFYDLYWSIDSKNLLIRTNRENGIISVLELKIILPCDYKKSEENTSVGSAPEVIRITDLNKNLFSESNEITQKELDNYGITKKGADDLLQSMGKGVSF